LTIAEKLVSPGQRVTFQGAGFTPNDTVTVQLVYLDNLVDSRTYQTDANGAFSGGGTIPAAAADFPGTYTIVSTDTRGRTASDSTEIR
jgi:hypothetical protein